MGEKKGMDPQLTNLLAGRRFADDVRQGEKTRHHDLERHVRGFG